jgi:hypothetical protein
MLKMSHQNGPLTQPIREILASVIRVACENEIGHRRQHLEA